MRFQRELTAAVLIPAVLAVVLIWRFRRTGGPEMLAMMDMTPEEMSATGA